jgi:alpha-D-xyloside xylohydrolase
MWTLGHWQCRERYKTSDELAAVLDRYRELRIPLDGIVQDWQYWGCDSNWNAMKFQNPYYINKVGDKAWERYLPDDLKKLAADYKAKGLEPRLKSPQEMVDYVHQNNAHLMISIWANFGSWTEPYKELQKIGALLPFDTWPRNKGVLPYDPFNPKARDIYWKYLSHLYQMGFDAWWTDSTEPDHFEETAETDAHQTYDGSWLSVKNAFPLMSNRGIYEHQRAMKGNKKRSIQMTRSGSFGIQRYATFSWSGDIKASWQEMKNQVPSGLNYTLCGIPYWNTDLGGFFYWDYEQSPRNPAVQELQTRWMQWGTFMPLMRNHCSSPMVSEIYEFGQKGDWAYDAMVDAVKLRYRLLPYIYSMMGEVVQHSGMMMRPLVMDFANDVKARRLNDEYMFGHALLVKPITDPMYTWKDDQKRGHEIYPDIRQAKAPVSVYLPTSIWYDFFTGERYEGGRTILRPTPITDMPVYVRAGSIIPFGPDVQYSDEKNWQELEIRVYPGADGTFTLYEDEGDGYNYERGAFTEIPFIWDDSTRTLTIGPRKGSYKGMLRERRFTIIVAGHTSSQPQTVSYSGEAISINL